MYRVLSVREHAHQRRSAADDEGPNDRMTGLLGLAEGAEQRVDDGDREVELFGAAVEAHGVAGCPGVGQSDAQVCDA